MAGGVTNPLNAAIDKARASWEASMLRQVDELGFSMEISPEGGDWQTYFEGRYRRA